MFQLHSSLLSGLQMLLEVFCSLDQLHAEEQPNDS